MISTTVFSLFHIRISSVTMLQSMGMEIDTRYAPYRYGCPAVLTEPVVSKMTVYDKEYKRGQIPHDDDLERLFVKNFDDLSLGLLEVGLFFRCHPGISVERPSLVFTANDICKKSQDEIKNLMQNLQFGWERLV